MSHTHTRTHTYKKKKVTITTGYILSRMEEKKKRENVWNEMSSMEDGDCQKSLRVTFIGTFGF